MNYSDETQKFMLPNEYIDINSLKVTVYENNGQNTASFFKTDTLFGLDSSSNVFFVQAAQNNQYEILFGDGFLGRKPKNEALIVAEYRVVNGTDADGITKFNLDVDLGPVNGGVSSVGTITVTANSSGGGNSESIESIRFYAPRYFATQQRAISTDDYSSIVLSKFGGEISDVNVYGGELLDPKQYGRVALCLKPTGTTVIPDYIKNEVANYMLKYISVPSRVIITDPDYFYLSVNSDVSYNYNITNLSENQLTTKILTSIVNFNDTYLNKFNDSFRYSTFVSAIDSSDPSIISNDTTVYPYYIITPETGSNTNFSFSFNTEVLVTTPSDFQHSLFADRGVYSSSFIVNGLTSQLEDDGLGNIRIMRVISNQLQEKYKVGTIDYDTGYISISNLNVDSFTGSGIKIYIKPVAKDYTSSLRNILKIKSEDVIISMIAKKLWRL